MKFRGRSVSGGGNEICARSRYLSGAKSVSFIIAVIAIVALNALPPASRAQGLVGVTPPLQSMLATPSNLDTTIRDAVEREQSGDLEASIGSLERLLFYNPKLIRARLELGRLYYRLGSYEMARGYFQSVLASPNITPEVSEQTQEFLEAIDKALRVDKWNGFFQTGLGYQTNASAGPTQQALLASNFVVDPRLLGRPDGNWFATFSANYVHDFGNQRGDVFEASIVGYDAQQFTLHEFDLGWVDVRAGPRFGIFQDSLNGASIKPYVLADGAILADSPYFGGVGGGLTMHLNLGAVSLDPYADFERGNYQNSSLFPFASGFNGTVATYALQAGGPLASNLRWLAKFEFNSGDDAFSWFSFNRYAFNIWLPWTVPVPWGGRPWIVSPTFGVAEWVYGAPDPLINPLIAERTEQWLAGVAVDIPISRQIGLGVQVLYIANYSNLAIYSVNDLSIMAGPTLRF